MDDCAGLLLIETCLKQKYIQIPLNSVTLWAYAGFIAIF